MLSANVIDTMSPIQNSEEPLKSVQTEQYYKFTPNKNIIEHISVCGFPWALAPQYIPQTRAGLSSVFGMGTGVSPPLWPMYSHHAYDTIWISPEPGTNPKVDPVHPVDLVKQDHPVRMLVVAD